MSKQYSTVLFLATAAMIAGCAGFLPSTPEVSDNSAVVALMDSARADIANGKLDAAVAPLERALRIEPRNPVLAGVGQATLAARAVSAGGGYGNPVKQLGGNQQGLARRELAPDR